MNKEKLEKTKLKNGLEVITYNIEGNIFSLGFGIKVGSLYESKDISGISHLIEHMLFKGTKNRNIDALNRDLEELATEIDIYTSYDQTVLEIDLIKSKANKAMGIIADMIINPSFDEKEFKLEKNVIIEEIKMGEDDPEDIAYQGLYKEAFNDNWHNYYITGTETSVKNISRNQVIDYHKKNYVPNNSILCVVSSYSHNDIVSMANKYFGDWDTGDEADLKEINYNIPTKKIQKYKKGISQSHIIYGFDISMLSRKESIVLTLLSEKLGSGGNSILFKELRDKNGLAYSTYSDIDFMKNLKMFYIYAGVSTKNIKKSCKIIDKIIDDFEDGFLMNENSLEILKERFIIDTEVTLQASSSIVDYILQGEIEFKNPLEYMEVLKIMSEVKKEDIDLVAKKVFKNPLIYILMPK